MRMHPKLMRKWLIIADKMRRRRFSSKKALTLVAICVAFIIVHYLYKWNIFCSNGQIHNTIDTLCEHFANGKAHGNLCREICVTRALLPEACSTFHGGKEVVFSATLNDNQPVYVKGRRMDFLAHPEEALHWGSQVFPSKGDFDLMVRSYLEHNMGIKLAKDADIMETLWFPEKNAPSSPDQLNWKMASVWSLIQDSEYVFSRLYAQTDIFPSLFGTCGGLFVVEALEPIQYPAYYAKLTFTDWAQRVSVALAMLDFLDELDNVIDEPVYLCDVKREHFGISDFGRVKFLDLDSVFLKSYLDRTMTQNVSCESHEDCNFFHCRGMCDLITNQCVKGVVNNNLQLLCQKILLSRPYGPLLGTVNYPGLLTSKHLNKRLKAILERCANPSGSKDGIRLEAGPDIRMELYKGLREVMDIARQIDHNELDMERLDRDDMK